jgi:hypothetical protein
MKMFADKLLPVVVATIASKNNVKAGKMVIVTYRV